ncbi:MAG: transporter substrate-binding domain-containing protein [Nanoarchaeota archaeon]|nr:transporter substrate-binding domain-containing protein [Nanoarchaeota archaeon]
MGGAIEKYAGVISVAIILLLVLVMFFRPETSNGGDTLDKMKKTGKLDVCYVVYPPAVIKDANTGELRGHMIDTLRAILDVIHVEPVYHEQSWGTAILGLQSGVCDVVATGFFINIPRAYSVAFTQPLFYVGDVALVKKNDNRFSTVFDADKKGLTVVVANGESGHNFVKENFKNADIKVIDVEGSDMSRIAMEVSAGRADIAIAGTGNLEAYARAHAEVKIIFADAPFNHNPTAWAVRSNDVAFLRFLENSLEVLEVNGKLKEFEDNYGAHWLHEVKIYKLG